jgi:hypothetical protein
MPKLWVIAICLWAAGRLHGGTLRGAITDEAGAPVPSAEVELLRADTGYLRNTHTESDGAFSVPEVPPGQYRVRIVAPGFQPHIAAIVIGSAASSELKVRLQIAGQHTAITVESDPADLLEINTSALNHVGQKILTALPAHSPDSGLNDAIIYTTGGVASDSNGFFHPMGDHAQVSYVIDGQPISDQRNKVFSTSIPANAIQSMEVVSGSPGAEYGDKTSLVINAVTRSGLGQRASGSFLTKYGSFGSLGEEATFAFGGPRWGQFLAFNSERSGRFLDSPEFWPMHDVGNTGTVFDRFDWQPNGKDAFHLNVIGARNWMQVPNTYSQPLQDQRQKVISFNVAPGYQHTISAKSLLTANVFFRGDKVDYFGSRDPLHDVPATLGQSRSLTNFGARSDFSRSDAHHNWKIGATAMQTRLDEEFRLGITDPLYNPPCMNTPAFTSTADCAPAGREVNSNFLPGLLPYDLTRGGSLFEFLGRANINQFATFGQDELRLGELMLSIGVRFDLYNGLTDGSGLQPRAAFAYLLKATGTVIRGGYSHTIETPTNENLVASSSTGPGGLASNLLKGSAEQRPIALGSRNQYDAGVQQKLGKWVMVDVSYFRKYTRNAFDFDTLFNTPITFPIGWKQSKLDGITARVSTPEMRGLRVYATMGHANARFFGPENGGIIFNSNLSVGAYRQDHDQIYQQNVNIHYQPKRNGWWANFLWRYDSGLVVGAVNDLNDALALTADQQSAIGLYCGGERASLVHRITACHSPTYGAERINILAPGAENDDRNPPRAKPRHIFTVAVGTENLFRAERFHTVLRFTAMNLSNEAALYNFLSPFSGTHWVQPRAYQAQLGWKF